MKNITIIELQEEQLDNINAASAGSFFKKIGKGICKGFETVGKGVCEVGEAFASVPRLADEIRANRK